MDISEAVELEGPEEDNLGGNLMPRKKRTRNRTRTRKIQQGGKAQTVAQAANPQKYDSVTGEYGTQQMKRGGRVRKSRGQKPKRKYRAGSVPGCYTQYGNGPNIAPCAYTNQHACENLGGGYGCHWTNFPMGSPRTPRGAAQQSIAAPECCYAWPEIWYTGGCGGGADNMCHTYGQSGDPQTCELGSWGGSNNNGVCLTPNGNTGPPCAYYTQYDCENLGGGYGCWWDWEDTGPNSGWCVWGIPPGVSGGVSLKRGGRVRRTRGRRSRRSR